MTAVPSFDPQPACRCPTELWQTLRGVKWRICLSLIRVSPEAYDAVIGTYKNPIMAFGEVVLVAGIAFHAFNGLRIIVVDFWSKGAKYQRQLFWIVLGLWAVVMAGFVPRHLALAFAGFGGGN